MNKNCQTYCLSDMTSAAFAKALAADPVILLPLGSHEDHGPHLPMGDYRLAEVLAERIARAAAAQGVTAFVAPCLPFGVADYFAASPGGLAMSAGSFRAVLGELLDGLVRHGVRKIVILNGHGGNVPVIHEVALRFKQAGIVIPSFYLWKIARQLMEKRVQGQSQFGHGAEPLMSLTMALRAETVAAEAGKAPGGAELLGLPVAGFGTVDFEGFAVEAPVEFDQVPRDAAEAAWPLASAEVGTATADALVELGARFVVHFAKVA